MINYKKYVVKLESLMVLKNILNGEKVEMMDTNYSSAFFISPSILLTCYHCIENSTKLIMIYEPTQKKYKVDVIKTIPEYDIAILKVDTNDKFEYLEISFDKLSYLEDIIAVGYPLGMDSLKISIGNIGGYLDLDYQITATVNPGNSGGPLIHKDKIYGIVSYKLDKSDGLSFCKGFYYMKNWFDKIMKDEIYENIRLSELDFKYSFGHVNLFNAYGIKTKSGILLTEVVPSSVFKQGDIVYSINANTIYNNGIVDEKNIKVEKYVKTLVHGTKVTWGVYRNRGKITVQSIMTKPHYILDHIYYKEEPLIYDFHNIKIAKLTKTHIEHLLTKSYFSSAQMKLIQYLEKYIDNDLFIISFKNNELDNYLYEIIEIYDIVKKINGVIIKSQDDLVKALSVKTDKPYLLTKNNKLIFF